MTTKPYPRRSFVFAPSTLCRTRHSPALLATGIALLACLLADRSLAGSSFAIEWGTARTISGDSDVRTDGSLVSAFNIGSAGVASSTVNGVRFEAFAFPEDMRETLSISARSPSPELPACWYRRTVWGLRPETSPP
jgi:hypothetical protein